VVGAMVISFPSRPGLQAHHQAKEKLVFDVFAFGWASSFPFFSWELAAEGSSNTH